MSNAHLIAVCLGAILLLPVAGASQSVPEAAPGTPSAAKEALHIALRGTGTVEWNPTKASDDFSWAVLDQLYDGLGVLDATNGQVVPWLAESWRLVPVGADTNVSVKLRPGIRFHDGSVLNADDVVNTYNNADLRANPRFAPAFYNLYEIAKVSDTEVNFVYLGGAGNGQFMTKTLTLPILPGGQPSGNIGSGAFRFVNDGGGGNGKATLAAFEGFFGGIAGFDELHYMGYATDREAGDNMSISKTVDVAAFFVDANQQVNFSGNHLRIGVDWGKDFTMLAINSGSMLNGIPKITSGVRTGLAYSIQKYSLTSSNNGIYKGSVLRTSSVLPPTNPAWYVPGLPDNYMPDYDDGTTGGTNVEPEPEELLFAADAFDSAGAVDVNGDGYRDAPASVWNSSGNKFDAGGTVTFEFLKPSPTMNGEPRLSVVGDLIANNIRFNGFKVTVTAKDIADLSTAVKAKAYDLALLNTAHLGTGFTSADPSFMSDAFRTGGPKNYFGHSDAVYDAWAAKIDNTLDQGQRGAGVAGAAWTLATKLPVDPLFFVPSITVYSKERADGLQDSVIHGVWGKLSLFRARPVGTPTSLSVELSASSTIVGSNDPIPVSGTVKDQRGVGVEGAAVNLETHGAGCIDVTPPMQQSLPGGVFTGDAIAAAVTSQESCEIHAHVTYRGIPQVDRSVKIVVYPKTVKLNIKLTTDVASLPSGETVKIMVDVSKYDVNGTKASGAMVTLTTGSGLSLLDGSKKTTESTGRATFDAVATTSEAMVVEVVAWVEYTGPMGEVGTGKRTVSVSVTSSDGAPQPINTPGFEALSAIAAIGLAFALISLLAVRRRK